MVLSDALAGTDALVALDAAHDAAWASVDPALLAVCRDRMAMLRGHRPTLARLSVDDRHELQRWPSSGRFDRRERAALELTEQFLVDVSSITDDQIAELRVHLDDDAVVDFVNALLVVEQRMSLELFFGGIW